MDTTPAPTWWEAAHDSLCEMAADPSEQWADAGPPFSDALLGLLADVEAAFARTGADTPPWPDPHLGPDGEQRDSTEEEYSRCLEPGKYRILWTRAEAWAEALTARGWARREDVATGDLRSGVRWAIPPRLPLHRTTVLRPRRPGAQPLVLSRTAPDGIAPAGTAPDGAVDLTRDESVLSGLLLGAGEPALEVELLPDCGCDACDSGSGDLLEQLDREILSLVDGSLELVVTPTWRAYRNSFQASGGTGTGEATSTFRVTAGPWADGWTPRPLSPAIEEVDSVPMDEFMRRARPGAEGSAGVFSSAPLPPAD